ncbi:hypothetical protein Hamer_G025422 [Homarus americanus]|uniref:Uncharacterized protein n=1 Tax=Homarus americanus TaxID=6706 RepID=A0A8J5MLN8_HOMAM|nr:hypothetical protein Hamer_G025422 [Homarus americanus]
MKAACDKCHGIDTYDIIPDFQDMLEERYRRPMYVPVPVYSPYQFPQYPQMPQFTQYGQVNQYNPYQNVAGMRTLDSNNMPNYAYIGQENSEPPRRLLREADFGEALERCRDFSNVCLPVEKAKNPLKKELGTAWPSSSV